MVTPIRLDEIRIVADDITKQHYLSSLIDDIFKILPTYEEYGYKDANLRLGVLLMDMMAADKLFDGCLSDVIVKLYVLYNQEPTHTEVRKRVLECTNLVRKKADAMYGSK